jgi:tetratricopeptide (TPR) repeat protein
MKKIVMFTGFILLANVLFAQNSAAARAAYQKGVEYAEKKDYDSAITSFTEALRINSNYADAYEQRGIVYRRVSAYDQAIADFTRAVTINPKLTDARWNRGTTYFSKGDYDKALDDMVYMLSLDPSNTLIEQLVGTIRFMQSFQIIENPPPTPRVRVDRANKHVEKEEFSDAISEFTKTLNMDGVDMELRLIVHMLRGITYYVKFLTEEENGSADADSDDVFLAIYDWKQILKLEPTNAEAKKFLQETQQYIK